MSKFLRTLRRIIQLRMERSRPVYYRPYSGRSPAYNQYPDERLNANQL